MALLVALAIDGAAWPFTGAPASAPNVSAWRYFLADRTTLGFVRFALVCLAVMVVASVPALIVAGRWLKGFGANGLTADDADAALSLEQLKATIASLNDEIEAALRERDNALTAVAAQSGVEVNP